MAGVGGARAGSGRKKLSPEVKARREVQRMATKVAADLIAEHNVAGVLSAANAEVSPLEYMLELIRNPLIDPARRDKLAIAAAPYCHARLDGAGTAAKGKKEAQKEAAIETAGGKFRAGEAPRLTAVVNAA